MSMNYTAYSISGVFFADTAEYTPVYHKDVIYAHRSTGDLKLQIFTPVRSNAKREPVRKLAQAPDPKAEMQFRPQPETRRFPLVVDIPGSGWSGTTGYEHIAQMVTLAKAGFVTASVEYRGTFRDDVVFPAAVQDALEALRFMRANADTYLVDADHCAFLGDSSGGHTALTASLANGREKFIIGDNTDQRMDVNCCVAYYGPNDITNLVSDRKAEGKQLRPGEGEFPFEAREIWQESFREDPAAYLADASVVNYIEPGMKLPKFMFLNGDDDPIIPLAQGIRFCQKIRECGGKADFYKIIGGGHGVGCWTDEILAEIVKFLKASI